FLANMSHELRTPLNAIIGLAEALEIGVFGTMENDQHRRYVADIRQSGHHLLALISDLLDLAKVEAGAMELEREAFALPALIEECLAMMRPIADARSICLRTEGPSETLRLIADRRKIKQVLINILSNAVKYSHAGGDVRVTALLAVDGLRIEVEDRGIGLDETGLDLVFQPFGRLHNRLGAMPEGAGLGLPIAQRFAELHGGEIGIASRLGKGTLVTLRLPPDILA
ncbi:MAG: HAMP domain-containing sensor histidine kinase, partial [Tistlia sp.]